MYPFLGNFQFLSNGQTVSMQTFHLGQDLELGFVDDQPGRVLSLTLEKAAQLADPNLN